MTLYIYKKYKNVCYLIIVAIVSYFYEEIQAKPSKYIVELVSYNKCPEPEYADAESPMRDIKIYKINRTVRGFNFNMTVKRTWDADVGMKIELDMWTYAGWTRIPYLPIQPDFCNTLMMMFSEFWMDILRGFGKPPQCPLLPGNYILTNYTFDATSMSHIAPTKGKFRARTLLKSMKTKRLILCLIVMIEIDENILN